MTEKAIYLTEADVAALVDLNEAIDALHAALVLEAQSETLNIPKSLGLFGAGGSLHSLGSAFPGRGLGGGDVQGERRSGARRVPGRGRARRSGGRECRPRAQQSAVPCAPGDDG